MDDLRAMKDLRDGDGFTPIEIIEAMESYAGYLGACLGDDLQEIIYRGAPKTEDGKTLVRLLVAAFGQRACRAMERLVEEIGEDAAYAKLNSEALDALELIKARRPAVLAVAEWGR